MEPNALPPEGVAAIIAALIAWAELRLLPRVGRTEKKLDSIATKLGVPPEVTP